MSHRQRSRSPKSPKRSSCKSPRRRTPLKSDATPILTRGAHIYRPIRNGYGATHHGIYMGNNEVIHFTGGAGGITNVILNLGGEENASIRKTSLTEFMDDYPMEKIKVFDYTGFKIASTKITLDRATSLLGETCYSLPFRNCEHFATWCKTGKWYSDQIKNAYDIIKEGGRWVGVPIPSWIPLNNAYNNFKHLARYGGVNVPSWHGERGSYINP